MADVEVICESICEDPVITIDNTNEIHECSIDFAVFPTELLLKIFSYLDFFFQKYTLSMVCKNWSAVCECPSLNRAYRITGQALSTKNVFEMLKDTPSLVALFLFERTDVHKVLRIVSRLCKKLKVLRIERCHGSFDQKSMSPSVLIHSVKRCRHLEKLIIKDTTIDEYGRSLLYTLGLLVPNLRKLTMVNIGLALREEELRIIVKCSRKLESITILETQGVQFTDRFVETTSDLKSSLRALKINAPYITDKSLMVLKQCENLEKLHLKYCLRLTDNSIYTISDHMNLTSIDLTMALGVNTEAWIYFFKRDWMVNVLKIVLGQCGAIDDEVLEAIGENCCSLQFLGLAGCVNITENGFFYVIFGCKQMVYLDLFYTPARLWKCFTLLPQNMRNLKKLIYRSSCGFQGNRYTIKLLKIFLPDLEIVDTIEKLK